MPTADWGSLPIRGANRQLPINNRIDQQSRQISNRQSSIPIINLQSAICNAKLQSAICNGRATYLDYHATTPVDPRVLEAMLPYFTEDFGNPASRQHAFGWKAQEAVDKARSEIGSLIGASGAEIVFTSGATESNNLAIKGAAQACRDRGDHLITVATEHKSILDSFKKLERDGWRVTWLGVDRRRLHPARRAAGGDHGQDGAGLGDGGEQRDWRAPAAGRDRRHRQRRRGAVPHRCGAGRRQGADRRPRDGHRPAVAHRAQVLRSEGFGRAVHPPPEAEDLALPARSTAAATSRACAPARSTSRASSVSAAPPRSAGRRWPPSPRGWRRCATACSRACAPAFDGVRVNGSLDAPAAAQPPRQLRSRRRGIAADGARRPRRVDRVGLQLRQPEAVARARSHRRDRRRRRRLDSLRPRPRAPPTRTSTSPSTASRPSSRACAAQWR